MAHDLVITNGTIVDGTGAPRRRGDLAIDGDRITEVTEPGGAGAAHRTIDADGRFVTPGFVDLHSHLDAQIGWDPLMSSSCWHGVTSVVMGNCGMTFAPVRPGGSGVLAHAMESVEDIPASCILDGLPWSWESYGEYLDVVAATGMSINYAYLAGHTAIRTAGDELREDNGHPAVLGGIADVVLPGGLVRGVQVEFFGFRVVGASRP